jgi:hypothetical protein
MIVDDLLLLSNQQAPTTGTVVSTNTIDTGVQGRDLGSGTDLFVSYNVDIAFTGGTSLAVQIITSASANLSSPTVLSGGPAHAEAALVVGFRYALQMPPVIGPTATQRYLGVQYVTVGTHSTGAITTRIVRDLLNLRNFNSGFAIL